MGYFCHFGLHHFICKTPDFEENPYTSIFSRSYSSISLLVCPNDELKDSKGFPPGQLFSPGWHHLVRQTDSHRAPSGAAPHPPAETAPVGQTEGVTAVSWRCKAAFTSRFKPSDPGYWLDLAQI